MTPKEALENILETLKDVRRNPLAFLIEETNTNTYAKIVEQALDELEETKVLCESFKNDANKFNEQCIRLHLKNKKQTEILEVLKNKVVAKERAKNCENVNAYNNYVLPPFSQLTETEFNLIKEWLK